MVCSLVLGEMAVDLGDLDQDLTSSVTKRLWLSVCDGLVGADPSLHIVGESPERGR